MDSRPDAVAVTGIGVISPYGRGVDGLLEGLRACRSCLAPLTIFDIDFERPPTVAEVREPLAGEDRPGFRLSRTDRLGLLAAQDAFAQVSSVCADCHRAGIALGTTVGGLSEIEPAVAATPRAYYRKGGFASASSYPASEPADAASAWLSLTGPRFGVSVACASGALAIALAARLVINGTVPMMLAGGADALCRFTLAGFNSLQALDPDPCRPFDQSRQGLNLGEGAAVLALESLRRARERKAHIWAVLRGWGATNDAFHPTAPHEQGQGVAESILAAVRMAGVGLDEIGYVNAHGTGTPLNDIAETKAYEQAFRGRSSPVPVSSSKSYFGHALGAAGALEAVVTILSLHTGTLFPTLRLSHPIESPSIDWLAGNPRRQSLALALSVSAGFGGSNTSLLFGCDG